MKVLIAGWFSFEQMGATAGDLISSDVVASWLKAGGIAFDMALASPFSGGMDWKCLNASDYSHIFFICGPCGNGEPLTQFLEHFDCCRKIGLNLSMLDPLETWNPFDLLIERDSNHRTNPDLTFLSVTKNVPVVGVIQVEPQKEYKNRALHQKANDAIDSLLKNKPSVLVQIDTRLDENRTGLRTASEIESLISKMDLVVTTRLHGTVLAIQNGVPALAIDPIAGGAKLKKQTETIGWPVIFTADDLDQKDLSNAFDFCCSQDARDLTKICNENAQQALIGIKMQIFKELNM
ncbi:polysaccharide pyruvyl transferase family protein [Haliea sp. E17]|uniref:polysaccharide pyruvyl transferase family protein n=1 Tax=Haliea sp. E17 TaxID=3401576 RepID=UPI003AAD1E97